MKPYDDPAIQALLAELTALLSRPTEAQLFQMQQDDQAYIVQSSDARDAYLRRLMA